jgi:hypothetical protein
MQTTVAENLLSQASHDLLVRAAQKPVQRYSVKAEAIFAMVMGGAR